MDENKRKKLIEDIKFVSASFEEELVAMIEELGDEVPDSWEGSAFHLLFEAYSQVALYGLEETLAKKTQPTSVILKGDGEIN